MKLRTFSVLFCLLAFTSLAIAQVQVGTITGTVLDPQGNVIPDAKVTVRDMQTGAFRTAIGDKGGVFTVPGLPFGTYAVTIEVQGFRKWETANVKVITAQEAIIKATLEIGSVSEVVTVEAGQAVINTVSAELTTNVSRRQILDLPLPTRNPVDLVSLQAGVTGGVGTRTSVFNGLRGSTNNITQDGVNVQDNFIRSDGFFAQTAPTVENTGEFSISSQNIGSDSGAGVGQVRITTPRGTGDFHGSLFYFHRNDAFGANTWVNNATNLPKDKLRQHRFGVGVGGPVWIPKVYNGHERTFFYFRYEGFRENLTQPVNRTVLSQTVRTGMFRYVGTNGEVQTVNLLTASSRGLPINAFTKSLIDATPLPNNNLAGDGFNTAGFQFNAKGTDPDDRYTLRFDHKLIDRKGWGTHWVEVDANWSNFSFTPDFFNNIDPVFPQGFAVNCTGGVCNGAGQFPRRRQLAVAVNSTLGPSMFNEFRFAFFRPFSEFTRDSAFPRSFRMDFPIIPGTNTRVVTNPEQNFLNQGRFTPNYTFIDNYTKVWRGHTSKAGFQVVSTSSRPFNDAGIIPTVTLGSNTANPDRLATSSFPFLPAGAAGNNIFNRARGIYQGLVGLVGSIAQTFNANDPSLGFVPGATSSESYRERAYNLYFNDSWRLRPKFTLNYGVRYELVPSTVVRNRRGVQPVNFVQDLFFSGPLFQVNPSVTFNDILTGRVPTTKLNLAGSEGVAPLWQTDKNNFAPFVGIAWQPISKTVVRSGFSTSYVRDGINVVSNAVTGNTGLQAAITNSFPTAGFSVVNPATNYGQTPPTLSFPIDQLANYKNTGATAVLFTFDPNLRTPYVLQWSFGIERELWPSTALEVRYVGNHAVKLLRGIDFNQINLTGGLLNEFNAAKNNLAICRANGTACVNAQAAAGIPAASRSSSSYGNWGLAGQQAVPTLAGSTSMQIPVTFFSNSTFVNNLDNNEAGQFWFSMQQNCTFNYFANNGVGANSCPGLGAFPANFFVANPLGLAGDVIGNTSSSVYHGLQVEVRRRLARGVQFQGNYTFGKVLTDFSGAATEFDAILDLRNPRYDRSRATFDIHHTFHFNGIWELPVGRGRHWVSSGVLGKVLEGWQAGSIWTWRSGRPTSILSGRGTVNRSARSTTRNAAVPVGLSAADVCSQVGVYKTSNGAYWLPEQFFVRGTGFGTNGANSALLANPAQGQLGGQGLYLGCSGPRFFQLDMNFVKRTHITEKLNVEFRAEFFNIFNNPNFLAPQGNPPGGCACNANINNTGFASLNDPNLVFTPREIQFNIRVNF